MTARAMATAPRTSSLDDSQYTVDGWKSRASCVGVDPEVFFANTRQGEEVAVEICQACPVIQQCLDESLKQEGTAGRHIRYGVRGGLTPVERFNHARRARAGTK